MAGRAESGRRITRRRVLGGSLGAATLAFAYAAYGHELWSDSSVGSGGVATAFAEDENGVLDTEAARVGQLLRRAGFGVSHDELAHYQSLGLDATIDELVNYEAIDDSQAVAQASGLLDLETPGAPVRWWLTRILNTKRPLQEKLTLFWHGLLTSQISVVKDPAAMIAQNELLRANAKAAFPTILKAITADPAMMVYLDISGSSKEAPNENYARELMELFSMGEGTFTENDVREAARAFTGWRVPRSRDDRGLPVLQAPVFQPRRYDDGSKEFFGQTGNFGPDEIIDIIVAQPASASYITGRLFSFFVYPDPEPDDLAPFVEVYLDSGYSIGATLEAMFRSEVFYSQRAYRAIVKSPVEYAIGAVKALGLEDGGLAAVAGGGRLAGNALTSMGQIPMEPPNVAGWPGGAFWLNSSTLFARLNLVDRLASVGSRDALPEGLGTATALLDYYLPLLMDGDLPDEARQVLFDYAGGPDVALSPALRRDLVYILLASPQFHLA